MLLIVIAALALRFVQILLGLVVLPTLDTVELLHDDAYYYLGIARSLALGHGSSFGGLIETNGYQFLWQMILAGQAWLLNADRTLLFVTTATSGYIMTFAVAAVCLYRHPAATQEFRSALLIGLLLAGFAYREVFWHGMESTLFIVLFPWLIAIIEGRLTRLSLVTACFVLLPLARLDALSLVGASYLMLILRQRALPSLRQLIPALAVIIVMIAYAWLNQYFFGTPLPISGLAKAVDSPQFANFGIIHYYLNISIGVALGLWLAAEYALRYTSTARTFLSSIAVMAIATTVQYLYYACLSGWALWPWYLYLEAGLVITLYARIFILIPHLCSYPHIARLSLLFIIIFSLVGAARNVMIRPLLIAGTEQLCNKLGICPPSLKPMRSYGAANLELIASRGHLLRGKTIAMGDRAGSFGFWLPENSKLLQTEGLVGNLEFLKARMSGHGEDFMVQHKVDLFIVDRQNDTRLVWQERPLIALAEPIQGRVANKGAMYFCFPESAELSYRKSGAYSHQRVYDFTERVQCPEPARLLLLSIETGTFGLRRLAVTREYGDGNTLMARLEARDRHATMIKSPQKHTLSSKKTE